MLHQQLHLLGRYPFLSVGVRRAPPLTTRCNLLGQRGIAWRELGYQGQPPDLHHRIGGDRRKDIVRIDAVEAGDRDRVGGMKMHDGARLVALAVHGEMEETFLRRCVARDELGRARRRGAAERGFQTDVS